MPNVVATKKMGYKLHLDGALMHVCWLFSVAMDTVPGERLLGCSLVQFKALALCAPSAKNMFPLIFTPPPSWPPSDLDSESPSQWCLSWPSYLLLLLTTLIQQGPPYILFLLYFYQWYLPPFSALHTLLFVLLIATLHQNGCFMIVCFDLSVWPF